MGSPLVGADHPSSVDFLAKSENKMSSTSFPLDERDAISWNGMVLTAPRPYIGSQLVGFFFKRLWHTLLRQPWHHDGLASFWSYAHKHWISLPGRLADA